jgi:hypothetical protein
MWANEEFNYRFTSLSGRAVEFVTMRKGRMLSMEGKGERMIIKFNIPSWNYRIA